MEGRSIDLEQAFRDQDERNCNHQVADDPGWQVVGIQTGYKSQRFVFSHGQLDHDPAITMGNERRRVSASGASGG